MKKKYKKIDSQTVEFTETIEIAKTYNIDVLNEEINSIDIQLACLTERRGELLLLLAEVEDNLK